MGNFIQSPEDVDNIDMSKFPTPQDNEEYNKKMEKRLPVIAKKDLKKWTEEDVKEWLGYNFFRNGDPFTLIQEKLVGLTGKDLDDLTEKDLKERDIRVGHRKMIIRAARTLKERRTFNYYEYVVLKKIQAMTKDMGKVAQDVHFLAKSLSDPGAMVQTYLNPSILQESFEEYIGEDEMEGEDDEGGLDDVAVEVEQETFSLKDIPKEKLQLPVKLVVTEMVRSKESKTARRLLSPVLSRIPSLQRTFGIFHTALIIGPWYIEWIDSSLCIPRKLYSGMALVSADVETSMVLNNMSVDDISKKLAETICRWNTTKIYKNMSPNVNRRTSPTGNCQDFVEDVMNTFLLTFEKHGAFGKFLNNMREKGMCELVFAPSKEFKERFQLTLNRYRFDSHEELDEFVIELAKVDDIALRMDFLEEEKLLKSFDRAFWLRHFKRPGEQKFKPSKLECPFEDPRKTKSYS